MGERKMLKLSLILQVGSLIHHLRLEERYSIIDPIKIFTNEGCNTQSVKSIKRDIIIKNT